MSVKDTRYIIHLAINYDPATIRGRMSLYLGVRDKFDSCPFLP